MCARDANVHSSYSLCDLRVFIKGVFILSLEDGDLVNLKQVSLNIKHNITASCPSFPQVKKKITLHRRANHLLYLVILLVFDYPMTELIKIEGNDVKIKDAVTLLEIRIQCLSELAHLIVC